MTTIPSFCITEQATRLAAPVPTLNVLSMVPCGLAMIDMDSRKTVIGRRGNNGFQAEHGDRMGSGIGRFGRVRMKLALR